MLLALFLMAGVALSTPPGSTLTVKLEPRGAVDATQLVVVAEPADGASAGLVTKAADSRAEFTLPIRGSWQVTCRGTSVWCPKVEAESGTVITLPVYRAARLSARLHVPRGHEPPAMITVQGRTREEPPLSFHETVAPVAGEVSAAIPLVHADLRLAPAGYVPIYRFDVTPLAGEIDLGAVSLMPGSSVAGRVVEATSGLPVTARLRLQPAGPQAAPGRRGARPTTSTLSDLQSWETTADARGFFQFTGVAAGRYQLEAFGLRYAPHSIAVDVAPDGETYVERVALRSFLEIEVVLEPPVDPEGQLWRVGLAQGAGDAEPVWVTADPQGVVAFSRVRPGSIRLRVQQVTGDEVLTVLEEVLEDRSLRVEVPLVRVIGQVVQERSPIPHAEFSLETGQGDRVHFVTDERGEFEGYIRAPNAELRILVADIEIGDPPQMYTVPLEDIDPAANPLRLQIDLGGGGLAGLVVDERGSPVDGARVTALETMDRSRSGSARSGPAGQFKLLGLAKGQYVVSAAHERGTSEDVKVELGSSTLADVRLTLRPWRSIKGVVRTGLGTPIPHSRVRVRSDAGDVVDAHTEATGGFALKIRHDARHVVLQAHAPSQFLWSTCRLLPEDNASLEITLPLGAWGSLVLPTSPQWAVDRQFTVLLTEGGGFFTLNDLGSWRSMLGENVAADGIRAPRLAAGEYGLLRTSEPAENIVGSVCAGRFRTSARWLTLAPGTEGSFVP